MKSAFWRSVYFIYSLGGAAVRTKRSRLPEIACLSVGVLQLFGWMYALATNYEANVAEAPVGLGFGAFLVLIGMLFRHVRLRSSENPHYLIEMRRAH